MRPKQTELESAFEDRMRQVAKEAWDLYKYPAQRFLEAIGLKGARGAAKDWLATRTPQEGFTNLFLRGGAKALLISMEAVIVFEPRWHELFTPEEIEEARRRLIQHDVAVPQPAKA